MPASIGGGALEEACLYCAPIGAERDLSGSPAAVGRVVRRRRQAVHRQADRGLQATEDPKVGLDVAGVVEAVGANVRHVRPGDRVFGSRSGVFAELVSGETFVPMPMGMTFPEAAALPTAGTTALQAVRDQG